jgi:phosphoesterase family protein
MRSEDSRAARARSDINICKQGTIMGIENIDHFIVLMLENRSFDHLFGRRPGVDGLKGTETNTVPGFAPVKATGGAPFEIPTKNALGPLHNVVDVNVQLYGDANGPARPDQQPSMDGFAASYLQGFAEDVRRQPTQDELALVMQSFDPDALPAISHHPPPPFTFNRLGLRVPTLIISPWVDKQVCSTELRHTSILRTVRERFGITRALSKRENSANTFSALFDRAQPRTGLPTKLARPPLPTLAPPDHHANPANAGLDDLQREIRDGVIAVTRRSHPEDEDKIWLPKTQGETSDFIRQRWTKHKEFLRQHQA